MNITDMVNVIKGKTDAVKSKVKNFIDNDPKKAAAYGLLGAGAASVTYSLASGDAEQITDALGNAAGAVSRTASLYTPEIVGNTGDAYDEKENGVWTRYTDDSQHSDSIEHGISML
ncbi:MAG: hypothetical protein U9N09_06105 [Euryarchaeota archaeon]|nr:hypothetical protein [Euryarchaeota archaeon]